MNENVLRKLITSLNQHFPKSRMPLYDALRSERPVYTGKDGKEYSMSKEELVRISQTLPESRWHFLKVPIIIRGDSSGEASGWIVSGKDECVVLASISRKNLPAEKEACEMKIYMPHLMDIRRALPTTTVVMASL